MSVWSYIGLCGSSETGLCFLCVCRKWCCWCQNCEQLGMLAQSAPVLQVSFSLLCMTLQTPKTRTKLTNLTHKTYSLGIIDRLLTLIALSANNAFHGPPEMFIFWACSFLYGGLSLCRSHTVTAMLSTQQISGVGPAGLCPAASCQWGMLTLIDRAAACQDGPRLACGVHYRACDSSWCGEQCVIHIRLHTAPLYSSGLHKGVSLKLDDLAPVKVSVALHLLWERSLSITSGLTCI